MHSTIILLANKHTAYGEHCIAHAVEHHKGHHKNLHADCPYVDAVGTCSRKYHTVYGKHRTAKEQVTQHERKPLIYIAPHISPETFHGIHKPVGTPFAKEMGRDHRKSDNITDYRSYGRTFNTYICNQHNIEHNIGYCSGNHTPCHKSRTAIGAYKIVHSVRHHKEECTGCDNIGIFKRHRSDTCLIAYTCHNIFRRRMGKQ